jgi:hypothetical protein
MRDGPQNLGIKPGETRQFLGIDLVALAVTVGDRPQLPHVRHDHRVSEQLKLFADPDRVRAGLHGHPNWRHILKPLLQSLGIGSEPAPVDHVSVLVDRASGSRHLPGQRRRLIRLGMSARNFCDEALRCLLHGKQFLRSRRPAYPISGPRGRRTEGAPGLLPHC